MTAQETFERGFHVQFYKNEPMIILLFQHEELYQESYENIKEEFRDCELFLEIKVKSNLAQLSIKSNDDKILHSNDLSFNKEELDDFKKEINTEQKISFFTDYATFANETPFPLSKWSFKQQYDRIYLNGYSII